MAKVREYDRLVRLIAESVMAAGREKVSQAEADVRREIEQVARQHTLAPLVVARGLWATFKERGARKTINRWLKNGVIEAVSPTEFERRREILDRYQKNARRVLRKRKENRK